MNRMIEMMRKRWIAGIVAATLAPSVALASTCPSGVDKSAIGTRYLLTEFMVAALACRSDPGFRDSYGTFVQRYNPGLVSNARALKSQIGGNSAVDSFVTRLANHAALRQNDGPFCSHARLRITRALAAEKSVSLADITDQLGYAQGGPACGDLTPVAALKEPVPAKAKNGGKAPAPAKAPGGAVPPSAGPTGSELTPSP